MEKKLEVKNLTISFRTMNGKVQAVRNISFDLNKGETLAIVGESGSGKSVTSKAIMGISAVNAIVENGEIIYDGRDLTKISEDQFQEIRGNKIAMIFQDPLSSLNPIVRIGKQLTEAMLLKGKSNQRESRRAFNSTLKHLKKNMVEKIAQGDEQKTAKLTKECDDFNKFETKHTQLEFEYNKSYEHAGDAVENIKALLFEIEKHASKYLVRDTGIIKRQASGVGNEYFIKGNRLGSPEYLSAVKSLTSLARLAKKAGQDSEEERQLVETLRLVLDCLEEALAIEKPNFFALGYYLTFASEPLPELSTHELNVYIRKYLDDNYMLEFLEDSKQALEYSMRKSLQKKQELLPKIDEFLKLLEGELDKSVFNPAVKNLCKQVEDAIDRLDISKNSTEYTFGTCILDASGKYFDGIKTNAKEAKRFAKETAKYERLVAKNKTPEWKVVPSAYIDLEAVKNDIRNIVLRLKEVYLNQIASVEGVDWDQKAVALIDYFKEKASGFVYKVTKEMAKNKAIKLMEEVGIPEARKRYTQYPFEFSGGMRQRIVIAIALAANPDILICDEPTTALDVTIQSQILELINKIKKERNLSIIFITHDLGVVANMADRIAVMYAGKIVELGTANDVFYDPRHPYTWALLSSMPDLDTNEKLEAIPGTPPNMIYPPVGDAFAARNKYAMKIDFEQQPPIFRISDTHYAATWLLHPDAPKVEPPKIVTARIERMKRQIEEANQSSHQGGQINE